MAFGARRRVIFFVAALFGIALASCTLLLDDDLTSPDDAPDANEAAAFPPDTGAPDTNIAPDIDAAADEIGNGTGRNGPLVVAGEAIVNTYASLASDVAAGAKSFEIAAATSWGADDVVLVWEMTGFSTASVGESLPIDLGAGTSPVGRFELARIRTIDAKKIELTKPLAYAYRSTSAQVVRVPEHTDVTITASGLLKGDAWDGARGGIIALLATGKIQVDGAINADAQGFRGGQFYRNTNFSNCPNLDGVPRSGYGAKGEGITPSGYSSAPDAGDAPGGRGVLANGGGGGNCHNAGGGGGGNGGAGGKGGRAWITSNKADVGGFGGRPIVASLDSRLVLGGGGGAGESEDSAGEISCSGARGGGAVMLRGAIMLVPGTLTARGANASDGNQNGGGGGGAGGTITIRAGTRVACTGTIAATGGKGSNVTEAYTGPGGGGGGGAILLRSPIIECQPSAVGGAAGAGDPGDSGLGPSYGAANGSVGTIVTLP